MKKLVGGVSGVVLLGGLGLGWKMLFATEIGGTCSDSNECRGFSGECLEDSTGSYCTKTCTGNQDCPISWTCTTAQSYGQYTGEVAICGRPFPGAPATMPGEVPATGMPMTGMPMPMTGFPGMPMTGMPMPFPTTGIPMTGIPMPMTGMPMTGFPATAQ